MPDRIYFSPRSIVQSRAALGRVVRAIGLAAVAIGAIEMAVCAVVLVRTATWILATSTSQGTIVGHETRSRGAGAAPRADRGAGASVAEIVRFEDRDGVERRFTSSISTSRPFAIGAPVPVRYLPDAPDDAAIDTVFRSWGLPLVFLVAGGLTTGVGFVFRRIGRRVAEG